MKLMRLNMAQGKITLESVPQDKLLGGRALIDWYMTEYVSPRSTLSPKETRSLWHPVSWPEPSLQVLADYRSAGKASHGRDKGS